VDILVLTSTPSALMVFVTLSNSSRISAHAFVTFSSKFGYEDAIVFLRSAKRAGSDMGIQHAVEGMADLAGTEMVELNCNQ